MRLPVETYLHDDVVELARYFLGKIIVTHCNGQEIRAKITETEAYSGRNDKACHASKGKTPRTEVMFESGGIAYTYLCYGIHTLFNIVTNTEGNADAVLIRAVEPLKGIPHMLQQRGFSKLKPELTNGPGKAAQALGITRALNGEPLTGPVIWLEDNSEKIPETHITASHRVGVDFAGKDALKNWRFRIKNNPFTGKDYTAKAQSVRNR